jgi:hypothetical protein
MKKLLTEQRLCELAGLQEVGPTGTQTWNPRDEREKEEKEAEREFFDNPGRADVAARAAAEAEEEDPDATQEVAPVQEPNPQIRKDLNKILTSLSKQMEREGNKEAQEMVNWLNLPERTPFGTMSQPSRVSNPLTGKESSYIHANPYNRKSVELMSYKSHPIRIGSPLDGGFPEHWSPRRRQAAGNIWQFMHNPQGFRAAQEVAQKVYRVTQATKGEKFPSKVPALDVSSGSPEAKKLIALLDRPDDARERGL